MLFNRYEDHTLALHYGSMLRECIRHQIVARWPVSNTNTVPKLVLCYIYIYIYIFVFSCGLLLVWNRFVLNSENMDKFFDYIQLPNFDIAADAAATFKVYSVSVVYVTDHLYMFYTNNLKMLVQFHYFSWCSWEKQ